MKSSLKEIHNRNDKEKEDIHKRHYKHNEVLFITYNGRVEYENDKWDSHQLDALLKRVSVQYISLADINSMSDWGGKIHSNLISDWNDFGCSHCDLLFVNTS